jgi:starch phosphorylase
MVQVYLNGIAADAVRVELYADGLNGGEPVRQELIRGQRLVGAENGYVYSGTVPATRPAADYTPRVIPFRTGTVVPLEAAQILWQQR